MCRCYAAEFVCQIFCRFLLCSVSFDKRFSSPLIIVIIIAIISSPLLLITPLSHHSLLLSYYSSLPSLLSHITPISFPITPLSSPITTLSSPLTSLHCRRRLVRDSRRVQEPSNIPHERTANRGFCCTGHPRQTATTQTDAFRSSNRRTHTGGESAYAVRVYGQFRLFLPGNIHSPCCMNNWQSVCVSVFLRVSLPLPIEIA